MFKFDQKLDKKMYDKMYTKTGKLRVDPIQRQTLYKLIEHYFYNRETEPDVKEKRLYWSHITNKLNTLGPERGCSRWRKFWTDILLRVRRKIVLRYENEEAGNPKKIAFSQDDLRVLRLAGGEEKLMAEFRTKSKGTTAMSSSQQILPVYCIDDSSNASSDFEAASQPVVDDFYEMDKSKDSFDSNHYTNSSSTLSNDEDVKFGQHFLSNETKTNHETKERSRKRRSRSISIADHCVVTSLEDQNEFVTTFEIDDVAESSDLNSKKKPAYMPNGSCSLPQIPDSSQTNDSVSEPQQDQPNQFNSACNEEMLNVQKQTLIEIQKLSQAQQQTNQLLRILIDKFENSSPASELPALPAETRQSPIDDIVRIIKGEN